MNDELFEKLMTFLIESGEIDTAEELLSIYKNDSISAFKESKILMTNKNIGYTFDNEYIMTEQVFQNLINFFKNIGQNIKNFFGNNIKNLENITDKIKDGENLSTDEINQIKKIKNPSLISQIGKYIFNVGTDALLSLKVLFPTFTSIAKKITPNEELQLFIAIVLLTIFFERKGWIINKIKMNRHKSKEQNMNPEEV